MNTLDLFNKTPEEILLYTLIAFIGTATLVFLIASIILIKEIFT